MGSRTTRSRLQSTKERTTELTLGLGFNSTVDAIEVQPRSTSKNCRRSGRLAPFLDITKLRQQNLLCHNNYREKHGVHSLAYNSKLNDEAQNFAEVAASSSSFQDKTNFTYGFNLYRLDANEGDGYQPCDEWYKENEQYDYDKDQPDNYYDVGHFTQLVSRASCFMGAGFAKSDDGWLYVAIFYYPKGNIKNEYQRNVFPDGTNRHKTTQIEAMMKNIACTDSDRETYLKQNLECHNVVREKYKVEPLTYSEKLNQYALEKAQWLAKRDSGLLERRAKPMKDFRLVYYDGIVDGYNYCQNYYNVGRKINIAALHRIDRNEDIDKDALGFPQMIWKSSRYMGFGMARSKSGNIYVVAVYDPPGNIRGQFKTNVFQPTSDDREWLSPDPDSGERF